MSPHRRTFPRRLRFAATCFSALFALHAVSEAIEYPTRTKGNTSVRIYEQRLMNETDAGGAGGPGHVIAKYSDLIQKAIAYKTAHSGETVEIRFTTYRMSREVYIGFNPAASSTYLDVSNTDFAGADSEKLIWSKTTPRRFVLPGNGHPLPLSAPRAQGTLRR